MVGRRIEPTRKRPVSRRAERRTLLLVALAGAGPVLAVALLIGRSIRPDLSDLSAAGTMPDGRMILSWPALLRVRGHALDANSGLAQGAAVCALGYLSGEATDENISRFVLLPETGSFLHPAHRFGDQMIEVRLRAPASARFGSESLVWACGRLHILPGDPAGSVPLYALADAEIRAAGTPDIAKYFAAPRR